MTKLNIGLESAYDTIVNDYDLQTLNEIVHHGCQSGVCSKHIYYGDTISFYEKYEEELTTYFTDNYGVEFLVDLFKESLLGGDLTHYKNAVCWAFIENVAFDVNDKVESGAYVRQCEVA